MALNEVQAEFVSFSEGEALLGRETALQLGVLKLGVPVYRHAVVQRSDHVSV